MPHRDAARHGSGARAAAQGRVALVLGLSSAYMVAEAVGGLATRSLALLADAGHMLSDVLALALTLFAMRAAGRPATATRTFGHFRAEVLAALANAATLVVVAVVVIAEAWRRLRGPPEVDGAPMLAIAAGGLAVNLVGMWLLSRSRAVNLNLRGAWLHVLGDALGSVGAIASGALVWAFGWNWADPVASAIIGLLILRSALGLLREALEVLMEGAPSRLEVGAVRRALLAIDGVAAVHDLHVWSISTETASLSCHLVRKAEATEGAILSEARSRLVAEFGIEHSTIQVEEVACAAAFHE